MNESHNKSGSEKEMWGGEQRREFERQRGEEEDRYECEVEKWGRK